MRFDSIIIGAGAAGMMAAITAARAGRKVAVFEKNDRIGFAEQFPYLIHFISPFI